jgi:hypothetical protein
MPHMTGCRDYLVSFRSIPFACLVAIPEYLPVVLTRREINNSTNYVIIIMRAANDDRYLLTCNSLYSFIGIKKQRRKVKSHVTA